MGEEGNHHLRVALLLSLLLTSVLAGCTQIQVESRPLGVQDALTTQASPRLHDHNIAVLAIDFDPPLETLSSFADTDDIALLVAVENIGLATEHDLMVRVELRLDNREITPTLTRVATVDELAPGETKIVRLSGLSGVPIRTEYWLKVRVYPVARERDTSDNQRIYRIRIGRLSR